MVQAWSSLLTGPDTNVGALFFVVPSAEIEYTRRVYQGEGGMVMATQRHHFLVTDIKLCKGAWHHKWSNTLVYELQTEVGQLILELTTDAAKKLRTVTTAP